MKKIVFYLLLLFSGTAGAQAIVVPDANFMAKLLASSAVNSTAKDSDGDAMAIDANGNGVITVEEAADVRELDVSGSEISSLTGIEYFVNLRVLICASNEISGTVNLSALENLRIFNCAYNNVTSISFAANNDVRSVDCSHNQLAALEVAGLDHLETLVCGTNQLSLLNVTGLDYLTSLKCNDNNLTTLDLTTNTALTSLTCYANDLVTLFVKNGQNETFDPANWIQNPTLEYICADESQVASIQANASLPETIQVNSYCSYEPGGVYNRIVGVVRFDSNNNNDCGDANDYVIPSFRLKITGGGYEDDVFTKSDGSYVFYVGTGNYTVTPVFENEYFVASPAAAYVPFPILTGGQETKNFCIGSGGVVHSDVEVVIAPVTDAAPGNIAKYKMVYKNKGNQVIAAGDVSCYWDSSRLSYVYMPQMPDMIGIDTYTWNYYNLRPFLSNEITMDLYVNSPTDSPPVNVGDVLDFGMSINPGTDEMPQDNSFEFPQVMVGALNANSIVCIEGETVSPDVIGDYLHYIVRFENTGTAPADFIVVELDVDPDQFDISTLRLINSYQPTSTRVSGDRVTFRFENASLSVAGHGNLLYKIKSRSGLTAGDVVTTSAKIFFEYNAPVETNDAETTLGVLSNGDFELDNSVKVYPNPAKGIVKIDTDHTIKQIEMYDIQGRLLQTNIFNESSAEIDLANRAVGIYLLKITTDKGVKVEKLIRE